MNMSTQQERLIKMLDSALSQIDLSTATTLRILLTPDDYSILIGEWPEGCSPTYSALKAHPISHYKTYRDIPAVRMSLGRHDFEHSHIFWTHLDPSGKPNILVVDPEKR